MKTIIIYVVIFLTIFTTVQASAQAGNKMNYKTHYVKSGETIFAISNSYKIPVINIKKANPGKCEDLKAGQMLKIPVTDKAVDNSTVTRSKDENDAPNLKPKNKSVAENSTKPVVAEKSISQENASTKSVIQENSANEQNSIPDTYYAEFKKLNESNVGMKNSIEELTKTLNELNESIEEINKQILIKEKAIEPDVVQTAENILPDSTIEEKPKEKSSDPITWKSFWKNGYQVQSSDKKFKMKFGGRIMYDFAFFFQDDSLEANFGAINNGTEFRRARFFNSGTLYGNMDYKINFDFAGGSISFKDVFITFKKIPVIGNVRVGHFKEPIRLEALTSSKNITFMERAFPIDFLPERNTGIMLFNEFLKNRLTCQVGLFRRSDSAGNDKQADDGYAITSRVTAIPLKDDENKRFLHVGLAYSFRKPESTEYKIASRPEAHLGHKYVSTGTLSDVFKNEIISAELACVLGPFSVLGEFAKSDVTTRGESRDYYSFYSYYCQMSYFITGESREYKKPVDMFDRVKPKNNLGNGEGGLGAWEVAVRYSGTDLECKAVEGGKQADLTVGVNWYLNPASRIMANYVLAMVRDVGNVSIFQMRFQVDF